MEGEGSTQVNFEEENERIKVVTTLKFSSSCFSAGGVPQEDVKFRKVEIRKRCIRGRKKRHKLVANKMKYLHSLCRVARIETARF